MVKDEKLKRLTEKNEKLDGNIEEIRREAKVFMTRYVIEERLKMLKDVNDNNVASWYQEAWEKSLKKFNGDEEVNSKIEKVGESEGV